MNGIESPWKKEERKEKEQLYLLVTRIKQVPVGIWLLVGLLSYLTIKKQMTAVTSTDPDKQGSKESKLEKKRRPPQKRQPLRIYSLLSGHPSISCECNTATARRVVLKVLTMNEGWYFDPDAETDSDYLINVQRKISSGAFTSIKVRIHGNGKRSIIHVDGPQTNEGKQCMEELIKEIKKMIAELCE